MVVFDAMKGLWPQRCLSIHKSCSWSQGHCFAHMLGTCPKIPTIPVNFHVLLMFHRHLIFIVVFKGFSCIFTRRWSLFG